MKLIKMEHLSKQENLFKFDHHKHHCMHHLLDGVDAIFDTFQQTQAITELPLKIQLKFYSSKLRMNVATVYLKQTAHSS